MRMRRSAAFVLFSGLAWCGACGDPSPPPTPEPNPGTGEMITGRERLGWTQRAMDAAELATFDYAIYVDGSRRALAGDTCTPSGAAFACSAPLPPLTAGSHALALAAVTVVNGTTIESPRSASLQVTVTAAASAAAAEAGAAEVLEMPDGLRLRTSVLRRHLDDPVDLAVVPDGTLLLAERSGAIVSITAGGANEAIEGPPRRDFEALESIAIHPEFARTRLVFAVYRTAESFPVVRLREAGGRLGEAAIVREIRATTAQASAVARFGPDRRLYVAVGAGTDPSESQNPASPLGKILRLNEDGSSPRDNPEGGLVFSSGHRDPRGPVWDARTLRMWAVDADEAGDELNLIAPGGHYGWPLARGRGSYPGATSAVFTWAPGTDVRSAAAVPLTAGEPFGGTIVVGARGAQDLLRVRIGVDGAVIASDRVLHGRFGRIGPVAAATDAVYFTTANRDLWGPGEDLLIGLAVHSR